MTPTAALPAIRATGLRKTFRATSGATVVAVDDIDLTIMPGEIVAFLGPNGAGKTTTVDMLLGLTTPDRGHGRGLRREPAPRSRRRPRQRRDADRRPAARLHRPRDRAGDRVLHGRRDRVDDVVERAGLASIARRRVQACSGGEQQRLQVRARPGPRPRPDHARRADHRDGRRRPAVVLGDDARRRRGRSHHRVRHPLPRRGRRVRRAHGADEAAAASSRTARTADVRAAFGGRTVTFRPPADVVHTRRRRPGLAGPRRRGPGAARRRRRGGLQRQPRGRLPRPHRAPTSSKEPTDEHRFRHRPRRRPGPRRHAPRPSRLAAVAGFALLDLRRQLRDRVRDVLHRRAAGVHVRRVRPRCRRARSAAATSRCTSWSRWRRTAPFRHDRRGGQRRARAHPGLGAAAGADTDATADLRRGEDGDRDGQSRRCRSR